MTPNFLMLPIQSAIQQLGQPQPIDQDALVGIRANPPPRGNAIADRNKENRGGLMEKVEEAFQAPRTRLEAFFRPSLLLGRALAEN